MAYGVKRIRIYDAVWALWQISGKLTLPDVSSPGSDVVGYPQIEIVWQDSELHGRVLAEDQAAFVQHLLDAVASYPNLTDITGTVVTPVESSITPTP